MQAIPALPWPVESGGVIKLTKQVTYDQIKNGTALAFFLDGIRANITENSGSLEISVQGDEYHSLGIASFNGSSSEITVEGIGDAPRSLTGVYELQNLIIESSFAYRALSGGEPSQGSLAVLTGTIDDGTPDGKSCIFSQDLGKTVICGTLTESGIQVAFNGNLALGTKLQSVVPSNVLAESCDIVQVAIANRGDDKAILSILVPIGGDADYIALSNANEELAELGDSSPVYLQEV